MVYFWGGMEVVASSPAAAELQMSTRKKQIIFTVIIRFRQLYLNVKINCSRWMKGN